MTHTIRPVTVSARVPAPAEEVFAFVSDTRNDPLWCPNVTDAVLLSDGGVQPGAKFRFHQVVESSGRKFESDVEVEVVDLTADTITWKIEDRFQERMVTLHVDADGDGCKVTQRTEAGFKRKPGLATRLLYPTLAKRTFRDQFEHLGSHFGQLE
jgi:Polyketide cyclase / dehydrase and lipid transport